MAQRKGPVVGKVEWIACRAVAACEGRQSELIQVFKPPKGINPMTLRYRCLTCKRLFQIVF